jgi:nitrate/nitrite transporter NarK
MSENGSQTGPQSKSIGDAYECMGGIYGMILLAWGLAAVPSPIMIARVHQNIGQYAPAVDAITIVMVVALVFPILARWRPGEDGDFGARRCDAEIALHLSHASD